MFFKENVLSNIYIRYEIVDLDFGKLDTLEIFEFPGASPLAIERHYFCSSETTFRGDRDQHTHREALVKKKKKKILLTIVHHFDQLCDRRFASDVT